MEHLRQAALNMRQSIIVIASSAVMGDEDCARHFDSTGALLVCDRRIHSDVVRLRKGVAFRFDASIFTEEWHLVISPVAFQFDGNEQRFLKDAILVQMLHGAPRSASQK